MGILSTRELDDRYFDAVRELTLSNGDVIRVCADGDRVTVFNPQGKEVGQFVFDGDEDDHGQETWRLTSMFLEGDQGRYKRQGIGTYAVRLFLWNTQGDFDITEDTGMRRDDGSHLIGDGPGFMRHLGKLKDAGTLFIDPG